jgi:hypothetical protein
VMTRLGILKRCMMSWMNSTAFAALYFTSACIRSTWWIYRLQQRCTQICLWPFWVVLLDPTPSMWMTRPEGCKLGHVLVRELALQTFGTLCTVWLVLLHLSRLLTNRTRYRKFCPPVSLRLHGCRSNLSGFCLGFYFLFVLRHIQEVLLMTCSSI